MKSLKSETAGNEAEKPRSAPVEDASCRCKETAVMTPRQLLGLMMRDLAFWKKKGKKEQHG